jgi:hypothetical protein
MIHQLDQTFSFGTFGDERIYRIQEVASILECNPGHIYDLIKLEKVQPGSGLIAVDIGTARKPKYRIRHSALLRFFVQRETQSAGNSVMETKSKGKTKRLNALKEKNPKPGRNFAERYIAQRTTKDTGGR